MSSIKVVSCAIPCRQLSLRFYLIIKKYHCGRGKYVIPITCAGKGSAVTIAEELRITLRILFEVSTEFS
jgi:hypothetical protein